MLPTSLTSLLCGTVLPLQAMALTTRYPGSFYDANTAAWSRRAVTTPGTVERDTRPDHANVSYTVTYSDKVVPVGVCNPRNFLQYVIDYGCARDSNDVSCKAKAEWPCDYVDDTKVGRNGWNPTDVGQAQVRNCTMGILANFNTSMAPPGGQASHTHANFMKDLIVKAIESPMQVDGGNTSIVPMPHGNGEHGGKKGNGRNVTVYQVPDAIMVQGFATSNGTLESTALDTITMMVECPQVIKEEKSTCDIVGPLSSLASTIGANKITTGTFSIVVGVPAVGGAGCQ